VKNIIVGRGLKGVNIPEFCDRVKEPLPGKEKCP